MGPGRLTRRFWAAARALDAESILGVAGNSRIPPVIWCRRCLLAFFSACRSKASSSVLTPADGEVVKWRAEML